MERLDLLARIGAAGDGGGITRPGLSAAEDEAHALLAGWCEEAGLAVSRDAVGNLYARPAARRGGRRDLVRLPPRHGPVGRPLRRRARRGRRARGGGRRGRRPARGSACPRRLPRRGGVAVRPRCFGSRCLTGDVGPDGLAERDSAGVSVAEALAALGFPGPPVDAALPSAYVEVHIEQGPILDAADVPLGDVAAIAGMANFTVTFRGASGHAGTVPMSERSDAFAACAELALRMRERAVEIPGAVATIGDVTVAGAASNVIPGLVRATVDVRAPTGDGLDALVAAVPAVAAEVAVTNRCGVDAVRGWRSAPVELSRRVRRAVRAAARGQEVAIAEISSGAGHDAGVLAAAGVDAGMLFVRSRNGGASHRPDELSDEADIAAAIAVLAEALRHLL